MPRAKPSFKDHLQYFKDLKIDIPDDSTYNSNTKVVIYCNQGHTYKLSVNQIVNAGKDPTICPHCTKEKQNEEKGIPEELIKAFADKNNLDYFPKKQFYNKWENDIITFKCKNDNYEFEIKSLRHWELNNQNSKIECPECIKRSKGLLPKDKFIETINTIEYKSDTVVDLSKYNPVNLELLPEGIKNLIKSQNKWILIEYFNTKHKCKYVCKDCGYIKECYPTTLFYGRGFGCPNCKHITDKTRVYGKLKNILENSNMIPTDTGNDIFTHTEIPIKLKCNECGYDFERRWYHLNMVESITCPSCHKSVKRLSQMELFNWIQTFYDGKMIPDCRDFGFEMDIYIPDKKLAIEYCGLIWHSTKFKESPSAHQEKLKKCNDLGIRLLTIFEDEWKDNRSICESRILNLFGHSNKIYARKCEIRSIVSIDALKFCKENHIQGQGSCNIAYGLYYNEELISVMTFSKPSVVKSAENKYDWELNRFCSKLNTTVVGGANKLLSEFIRNNKNCILVTFCDLRWGTGNVYEKMGFIYEYTTRPNYYYFGKLSNWKRKHRYSYNKQNLMKILNLQETELTETQLADECKLYKIYDCGHMKFKLEIK